MKTIKTLLILLLCLGGQVIAGEQEPNLPELTSPSALLEGTERTLTDAQINEILPWAKNSKVFLIDLLKNTQDLKMAEKEFQLLRGIREVVLESAPKHTEVLMRYVLNRGVVVRDKIFAETNPNAVGVIDVRVRILTQSIKMALNYYQNDLDFLMKKKNFKPLAFGKFGIDYAGFLFELNKSIFDASAQYHISRIALEYLEWDLYRDLSNKKYATDIFKIHNALKTLPEDEELADQSYLSYLRQVKKIYHGLSLRPILTRPRPTPSSGNGGDLGDDFGDDSYHRDEIQSVDFQTYSGMLRNSSWTARRTAVWQLTKIPGDDITSLLIKQFSDGDGDVVKAVYDGVLKRRLKNSHVDLLYKTYKKVSSWTSRRYIVYVLGTKNTHASTDYLIRAIADRDGDVTVAAYNAAAKRKLSEDNISTVGSAVLNASSWTKRRYGVYLLGKTKSMQAFRLLAARLGVEKDGDVIRAINNAMSALRGRL